MTEPVWLDPDAVIALHAESLAEFGGAPGLRDAGLLESALARPKNRFAYEGVSDVAVLAAAYAFGIVRNHPFADGNKRAAFGAVGMFLGVNGLALKADKAEATAAILSLAAGETSEQEFAAWLRARSRLR
jgi:death-on-curing protein